MAPPKKGYKAIIEPNRNFNRTLAMMEQDFLPRRAAAIMRYITYETAQRTLQAVLEKIPRTNEYKTYRDALKLVQSGEPSDPIFAPYAEPDSTPIQASNDLLFIQPIKRRGQLPDPLVKILVEFQPWTVDSLPFDVDSKVGRLYTRKVSRKEVLAVAEAREKDKPELMRRLQEEGIRTPPKKAAIPEGASAVPDLTYTALRLEYGLGRTKAVAHWRPATREAPKIAEMLFMDDRIASAMMDWEDMRWRKWSDLNAEQVPTKKIAALGKFQDKVSK